MNKNTQYETLNTWLAVIGFFALVAVIFATIGGMFYMLIYGSTESKEILFSAAETFSDLTSDRDSEYGILNDSDSFYFLFAAIPICIINNIFFSSEPSNESLPASQVSFSN